MAVVALLTDFGTIDGYVAAMKGRILQLNPEATIVDVTHEIPPFDIRSGAFALFNCYKYFPAHTAFVVVVDPGVGTPREGVVLTTGDKTFIGPDNGVFSLILRAEGEFNCQAIRLDSFEWPVSDTFHGRDVFAPLGALAVRPDKAMSRYLRPCSHSLQSFWEEPQKHSENEITARVLHVDRFGNVILNVNNRWHSGLVPPDVTIAIAGRELSGLKKTFGEVPPGELLINFDSSGFLQIAQNQGNAARTLGVQVGDEVRIRL